MALTEASSLQNSTGSSARTTSDPLTLPSPLSATCHRVQQHQSPSDGQFANSSPASRIDGQLSATVRIFLTIRDLPEPHLPKYVAVYADTADRPSKQSSSASELDKPSAKNRHLNFATSELFSPNHRYTVQNRTLAKVPLPRALSEPRQIGSRAKRQTHTASDSPPASIADGPSRVKTVQEQELPFARKHRSSPVPDESSARNSSSTRSLQKQFFFGARKHRSTPVQGARSEQSVARENHLPKNSGLRPEIPSHSVDEMNVASPRLAQSRRKTMPLSAKPMVPEENVPDWVRSSRVGDWARVGRTEIFRDIGSLVEFATPVVLSDYPDKDRALYICVYSVPRKPTVPHSLSVFGYVKLKQLTAACGSRMVIPVTAAPRWDEKTGKQIEVRLQPTAAILVCAEPSSTTPQTRYTLGMTANYIERSKSLGRSSTVNRTFYTIHLQVSQADVSNISENSASELATQGTPTDVDPQVSNTTPAANHSNLACAQEDLGSKRSKRRSKRQSKSQRKKDATEPATRGTVEQGSTVTSEANGDATVVSGISPPTILQAPGRTPRRRFRRKTDEVRGEEFDNWILVFRSGCVERINRKASGGTLDFNYFSTRPLISLPGATITDPDDHPTETGTLDKIGIKLGVKHDKSQLFSMPNATFLSASPHQRVMLSFYEDKKYPLRDGHAHGSHRIIAFTTFTMDHLRKSDPGQKMPFFAYGKEGLREVGTACLAQVEHCDNPKFFGLRANLPEL